MQGSHTRALRVLSPEVCANTGTGLGYRHYFCLMQPMPPNIPTLTTPANQAINCWQCRYFATSWDPALPYLCKLMGFKSKMLPSIQIVQLDGRPCQGFDAKPAKVAPKSGVSVSRQ
jgi:hypothetical protein